MESQDFDCFKIVETLGREHVFTAVTFRLIEELPRFCSIPDETQIQKEKLVRFLQRILIGYRTDVPYHNDLHGVDVAHMMFVMIKEGNLQHVA